MRLPTAGFRRLDTMKRPCLAPTPSVLASVVSVFASMVTAALGASLATPQSQFFGSGTGCPPGLLPEKNRLEAESSPDAKGERRRARDDGRLRPCPFSPHPGTEAECRASGSPSRPRVRESLGSSPATRPPRSYATSGRACADYSRPCVDAQSPIGPGPPGLDHGVVSPLRALAAACQAILGAPQDPGLPASSGPLAAALPGQGPSTHRLLHEVLDIVFERRRFPPSAEMIRESA